MLRLLDRCWPGTAVEEEQSSFNPIVERIEETFRAGSNCDQSGMPAAATYIPRQPIARDRCDEWSALADRIARERGRNMIVTLRRRGPDTAAAVSWSENGSSA